MIDRTGHLGLERRLATVESTLSALAERVEQIARMRGTGTARGWYAPDRGHDRPSAERATTPFRPPAAGPAPWFTQKSAEWWLGRLGIVFLSLALILLYQYAVDRNWITPLLRVAAGMIVGGGLVYAGTRVKRAQAGQAGDDVGLRELLLGGGLAAWYITAYAAAVYYNLISVPTARLIFLALSIISAGLALREQRALFGLIAVLGGFAAPILLPSPVGSMLAFSLYVAALTSLGLFLYLFRGWQSLMWATFLATWGTLAAATSDTVARRSIPLTLLVIAAAAAFVRVPVIRRNLVALGSTQCRPAPPSRFADWLVQMANGLARTVGGQVTRTDSPALWIVTLTSVLFMLGLESRVWPMVSGIAWGAAALALGLVAFRLSQRPSARDPEVTHLELTAAAVWTLAGLLWSADRIGIVLAVDAGSLALAVAALHAAVMISFTPTSSFLGPRTVASVTAAVALLAILRSEITIVENTSIQWEWTAAELVALVALVSIWKRFRLDAAYRPIAIVFGMGAYLASLAVAARVLGDIWQPLVTMSYAVAGAVLLVSSKRVENGGILRKLGSLTMLIVSLRLFVVDLAGVETIWRILLFLLCGILFLYSSYWLRPNRATAGT